MNPIRRQMTKVASMMSPPFIRLGPLGAEGEEEARAGVDVDTGVLLYRLSYAR